MPDRIRRMYQTPYIDRVRNQAVIAAILLGNIILLAAKDQKA